MQLWGYHWVGMFGECQAGRVSTASAIFVICRGLLMGAMYRVVKELFSSHGGQDA
jgi:hypothetical protein